MQSKLNDEAPRQLEGFNFNMSMSAQTRGESASIRVQTVHKKPGACWLRDKWVRKWLKGFEKWRTNNEPATPD